MHIIGIRLDGGKENVIKNLQPGWYPFGNFVEPVWKNNYEWRKPGSMAENLYQTCDPLPRTISVSCVVGANGSGKSTLLECYSVSLITSPVNYCLIVRTIKDVN